MPFKNKTYIISGASRGIGLAIAEKLAEHGANIVIAAKSVQENPKLGGTIYSAAKAIEKKGGKALPIPCDIRFEDQVQSVIEQAIQQFSSIDGVINNASAIALTKTEETLFKQYDLMQDINVRGTFLLTKLAIPYLKKSKNAHILTMSPPINLDPKWLGAHAAYTISKYNMSLLAMAWAEEFKGTHISSNALWPATTIATAAVNNLLGGEMLMKMSRKPSILADAAFYILQQDSTYSGQTLIDEDVLKQAGISNLDDYAFIEGNNNFQKDIFL